MAKKLKDIEYKGTKYSSVINKGKVLVYAERTAHGQRTRIDTYDGKTKKWENNEVPKAIRDIFESQAPTKVDKSNGKAEKHPNLGVDY